MDKYNTTEALKAQAEYCKGRGIPNFAPTYDGRCFHCGRDIYRQITHSNGYTTGITVEQAGRTLITGCPHCHYSFVD